jgi:hypothetical protein
MPVASGVNTSGAYPGAFALFDPSSNGVRGVAVDSKGFVYIASKDDAARESALSARARCS